MILKDFDIQCHLYSNEAGSDIHALGHISVLRLDSPINAWSEAGQFIDRYQSKYIFASLSYDLKDDIEDLESNHPAFIPFPSLYLFVPQAVFIWEIGEVEILQINDESLDIPALKAAIMQLHEEGQQHSASGTFNSINKETYIDKVNGLKEHIQRGDIYEVNYCQEFQATDVMLDPWSTMNQLNSKTQAPYACHLRIDDLHLMSGSPELFLEKTNLTVRSKPIKGTRPRGVTAEEDRKLKDELANDPKERGENIMITDLVRNDLSRTAVSESVKVEELCEIYSYRTVHQMLSTIRSEVSPSTHIVDILSTCFPMGSMTGAPKIRAMELIEDFESFRRGIYSGAVGLITPERNFTFNVVIRAILYDAKNNLASVAAGGAITSLSDAEAEYDESMLKARAMMAVLGFNL